MTYVPGPTFVFNCPHGVHPSLPCAACGRGYPPPVIAGWNHLAWTLTDADVDRIAKRVVELLDAARTGGPT